MKRLRTFIAVDLGKPIRERLVSLQERLAGTGAPVKWVETPNLHVTLLFLGEVDQRDVPAVCQAAADVCTGQAPFTLAVEGVSCFGDPRRPRTLWVGVESGAAELCALHDALEPPLLDLGCYRREERRYTPHITIGRVKNDRPSSALAQELAKLTRWQAGQTPVREILVMSSELTADGPIYTVMSRAKLNEA
jgi:2'-5' RNA ligase